MIQMRPNKNHPQNPNSSPQLYIYANLGARVFSTFISLSLSPFSPIPNQHRSRKWQREAENEAEIEADSAVVSAVAVAETEAEAVVVAGAVEAAVRRRRSGSR